MSTSATCSTADVEGSDNETDGAVERLFGFHCRIENYTPAPKRRYGYYVWPFPLDGRLVSRVDLKADRARGALHAVGAFAEPGEVAGAVAAAWASELQAMASWLGLDDVTVVGAGRSGGGVARAGLALLRAMLLL